VPVRLAEEPLHMAIDEPALMVRIAFTVTVLVAVLVHPVIAAPVTV
jgi:hypothetical protein